MSMSDAEFGKLLSDEARSKVLIAFARKRFSCSTMDAEDLAQQALMKAWIYRSHYRGNGLRPWLFAITYNLGISVYRKVATQNKTIEVMMLQRARGITFPPQEGYMALSDTMRAMSELSPELQAALLNSTIGYTDAERMPMEGGGVLTRQTMRTRVIRARAKLQADLEKVS